MAEIIPLNNIHKLIFVKEMHYILLGIGIEFLNFILMNSGALPPYRVSWFCLKKNLRAFPGSELLL
jgi:hypothetical protein